jgi:hypothetical protein
MIRYIPTSNVLMLQAAHIVQIRVDQVEAPAWGDQATRQARLHMTITEVWKGPLSLGPLVLPVTQNLPPDRGPIRPSKWCWGNGGLQAGEIWIVFSRVMSERAEEALAEGSCMRLAPPPVAIDIRIVDRIESDGLALPAIAKLVTPGADRIHLELAHYLAGRFGELHLEEKENLNATLGFVEVPALTNPVRLTLLDAIETYLTTLPLQTEWHFHRLIVAMFGLLAVPEASDLHDNLIEIDLPNLLGLTGGAQKQSANAVFSLWPRERPLSRRALESYRGPADTKPLLAWINER